MNPTLLPWCAYCRLNRVKDPRSKCCSRACGYRRRRAKRRLCVQCRKRPVKYPWRREAKHCSKSCAVKARGAEWRAASARGQRRLREVMTERYEERLRERIAVAMAPVFDGVELDDALRAKVLEAGLAIYRYARKVECALQSHRRKAQQAVSA